MASKTFLYQFRYAEMQQLFKQCVNFVFNSNCLYAVVEDIRRHY